VNFVGNRSKPSESGSLICLGSINDLAFAFAEDDAWDANYSGVVGHIAQDSRCCSDAAVFPDCDVAKNLGAAADDYAIFEGDAVLQVDELLIAWPPWSGLLLRLCRRCTLLSYSLHPCMANRSRPSYSQ